jgi:alkanesulfonate monooxygenase SsuD/methylene tetrahydromethanopterin reductase-like flavin-dependent oxidoreductase (luciferase family)
MSEGGAKRAARFDTHLLPQGTREAVLDPWRDELVATGRDPADYRVGLIRSWLVTDDPERDWPPILGAERYRMELYTRFFEESDDSYTAFSTEVRPIPQTWMVGSSDDIAAEIARMRDEFGVTDLCCMGVPPGVPPSSMAASFERFASEVIPRFRT